MAFKTKIKSKIKSKQLTDDRLTVDAQHSNALHSFTEKLLYLPVLQNELSGILIELTKLNNENILSPIINLSIQQNIWRLDDRQKELEQLIYNIKHNTEENNYMLKTGKILSEYYKILEQEKQCTSGITSSGNTNKKNNNNSIYTNITTKYITGDTTDTSIDTATTTSIDTATTTSIDTATTTDTCIDTTSITDMIVETTITDTSVDTIMEMPIDVLSISDAMPNNVCKKQSVVDWFSQSNENSGVFVNVDTGKKIVNIKKKKTLNDFKNDTVQIEQTNFIKNKLVSKNIVYEQYMKAIDNNYININNSENDISDICSKCMVEMLLNNTAGMLICPKCGLMENIIVDSDKPSFKEPPKEMTSFCYKRINHLNEFLAQFQAKETTDIPEDVYNEILMEIKKERITNMVKITPDKMRILLKKIKKNDYYEHIPYIINQLNGLPAPVIAPEIEEIIRGMFKAIQIPFVQYCPQERKNFLSYNYVMYKFFELLELDEYLTCFQLLKSRTKLHQQDQIWKNICNDLNWEFIKSL